MAAFRKTNTGRWRCEIRRKGIYRSSVHYTKAEAREWANQVEREIDTGKLAARSTKTLGDAFTRYSREVSPGKKGRRWEEIRLKKLGKDDIADIRFCDLTAEHLERWRDRRAKEIANASVNREMTLISSVITQARRVWGWTDVNPFKDVKRLKPPPHRDRRITQDEIDRIDFALGYDGLNVRNKSHEVAVAFLLAIETGMRLSEITGIQKKHVHLDQKYLRLPETKNGEQRDVPLSKEAIRLLGLLPDNGKRLFSVSAGVAGTLFRKARDRAEIHDLTFHDSRHEACSRLALVLDVLDLARMLGIKDPRILMVYFNARPHEIAARLDAAASPNAQPHPETTEDACGDQPETDVENPACR